VVQQYACNGTNAQRWTFTSLGTGHYELNPQTVAGRCAQVSGGSTAAGASVLEETCDTTQVSQSWMVVAP
jgi:hypothetical protein